MGGAVTTEWFQISTRYRLVARFPEGLTGLEALIQASGRADWRFDERDAGDQYLRVYAPREDQMRLTAEEWKAFKMNGGSTYDGRLQGLK